MVTDTRRLGHESSFSALGEMRIKASKPAACGVPRAPPTSAICLSGPSNKRGCFAAPPPMLTVPRSRGCDLSPSGHGFKFGPLIGKLLCELSQGEKPSHDLSPFRIARFQEKIKSAL